MIIIIVLLVHNFVTSACTRDLFVYVCVRVYLYTNVCLCVRLFVCLSVCVVFVCGYIFVSTGYACGCVYVACVCVCIDLFLKGTLRSLYRSCEGFSDTTCPYKYLF